MPTYGKQQRPAGVNKSSAPKLPGKRIMVSKQSNIQSGLSIDNCPYKGPNAALNAQKK